MKSDTLKIPEILAGLASKDIKVWVEGSRLRCNAPAGALTAEFRDQLRDRKDEIIGFLNMAAAATRQQPAIVPLQSNGTKTPIYAVPGHVGVPFSFSDFSKQLGDDQPFYALQPPGLDGKSKPLERVEDIAEYFAGQILEFQPSGPYIIAGYCSGAATAIELAKILEQRGAEITCVALFGPFHPITYQKFHRLLLLHAKPRAGSISRHMREIAKLPSLDARRRYLVDRLHDLNERLRAFVADLHQSQETAEDDPVLARRARLKASAIRAIKRYTPTPYAGRVCMFIPNKAWVNEGSEPLRWLRTMPRAEVYYGPDDCYGPLMLEDPNAPAIAELYREAIWRR
ncbi:thioesterase domain-containing protein [Microvirga flocculans]|uniref:Thioesterase domain-containing protein n=1 Tax=Microvirga flocculans TaxID=217168 RepID=A0A7W6NA26_9HYPH|nr:alpha/beta fold hydrolase [Microvirga flocculans]MBB4042090.1 thioesterase domain-containing protein [Microvirga flocculans]